MKFEKGRCKYACGVPQADEESKLEYMYKASINLPKGYKLCRASRAAFRDSSKEIVVRRYDGYACRGDMCGVRGERVPRNENLGVGRKEIDQSVELVVWCTADLVRRLHDMLGEPHTLVIPSPLGIALF